MVASPLSKTLREIVTTVVIIHDNEIARSALRHIVEQCPEFSCVGSYARSHELISRTPPACPDMALIDLDIASVGACIPRLKELLPALIVVVLANVVNRTIMAEAVAAGANEYLLKPFTNEQCLSTLRFAVSRWGSGGQRENQCAVIPHLRADMRWYRLLTAREHQVISGLAKGLLYKEIADELGISFSAVHKHQHKIFVKLRVTNRTEAITKWRNVIVT